MSWDSYSMNLANFMVMPFIRVPVSNTCIQSHIVFSVLPPKLDVREKMARQSTPVALFVPMAAISTKNNIVFSHRNQ
jgi:hypothetical protein